MHTCFYSILASVSCPKALYHLESDNLFRITFVPHSSPSCYVTLRTQVISLNSSIWVLRKPTNYSITNDAYFYILAVIITLKTKKTHGFNSCVVISEYPLDIPSIKAT